MQIVTLPGTSLSLSRVAFGTGSLHQCFLRRDRADLLGTALDAGITHFDTARMYGEGLAEQELGRFLKGKRREVTLATKFGIPAVSAYEYFPPLMYCHRALGSIGRRLAPNIWDRRTRCVTRVCAEESLHRSLRSLRTDWIDLFLLHEPQESDCEHLEEVVAFLQLQRQSGTIRYLGLSGDAARCLAISKMTGDVFDVLQVHDSLGRREADRLLEVGRPLQMTYGYLRVAVEAGTRPQPPLEVMAGALKRNSTGAILVSSRQPQRLRALAQLAA